MGISDQHRMSNKVSRSSRGIDADKFRIVGHTSEFQMDFQWVCFLPSLGKSGNVVDDAYIKYLGSEVKKILKQNDEPTEISSRVYAASVAFPSFEVSKVNVGNRPISRQVSNDVSSLTLTIDEKTDGATLQYLSQWQMLIKNPDGSFNPPSIYKRDIIIQQTRNNGEIQHLILFEDAFPTEISQLELSYDNSSVLQYNVSFSGDAVSIDIKTAYDSIKRHTSTWNAVKSTGLTKLVEQFK